MTRPIARDHASPATSPYRAETAIHLLGGAFYDPAEAATFPQTILRFRIGEVEAIWDHIDRDDDWSALYRKIDDICVMGEAMAPKLDRMQET